MSSIATVPPSVEILVFAGCPNAEPARSLVARVARELAIEPEIRVVVVPDAEAAQSTRFLGSPSVRVDGRDVEPGTEHRRDYTFSCRIYRTPAGLAGQPDETWMREALTRRGNALESCLAVSATREDVQGLVGERAQLVEVLPAAEYEDQHLPGAINIPLQELAEAAPSRLDPSRPVIVYCYDYQ